MDFTRQAYDWETIGLCQIAAASTLGGGGFLFTFRSYSLEGQEAVFFVGGGLGLGGSAGGMSLPIESRDEEERRLLSVPGEYNPRQRGFSRLNCERPFSLATLHNSFGRITSVGASLGVGVAATYISAYTRDGALFYSQSGVGGVAGVGTGGFTLVGKWKVGRILFGTSEQLLRRKIVAHI